MGNPCSSQDQDNGLSILSKWFLQILTTVWEYTHRWAMSSPPILSKWGVWKAPSKTIFAQFRSCKFDSYAYSHDYDSRNNNNIDDLKNEVLELKLSIKKLCETCQKEATIKTLEEEVKVLKLKIKRLFAFTKTFSKKSEEIQEVQIHEEIVDNSNIPDKKNIARIAKRCPENITSVVKCVKLLFPKNWESK